MTFVDMAYEAGHIDGTRIIDGDRRLYASTEPLAIDPMPGDVVAIGGIDHTVVSVRPLSPGGSIVYYEIQARRV